MCLYWYFQCTYEEQRFYLLALILHLSDVKYDTIFNEKVRRKIQEMFAIVNFSQTVKNQIPFNHLQN
jgi:hypothetical protein